MRAIAALGIAVSSLLGSSLSMAARAADLAYPPPPVYSEPDPQYEFGTGWYLRGDASFGPEDQPKLTTSGFTAGDRPWGWGVGLGGGYRFNSFLRADLTGDYFDPQNFSSPDTDGNIPSNDNRSYGRKAELQRWDGLANLYVDLGTWYGLTPYVGGGVGIGVFNPSEKYAYYDTSTSSRVAVDVHHDSQTTLAWAAMAGIGYQLDPNITIDLGYRHLDLGRYSATLMGYGIDRHYTTDELRLGVRYNLN